MNPLLPLTVVGALAALPMAAQAVSVQSLVIQGFSFQVVSQGGAASAIITEATPASAISPDAGTALNGGAPGPVLGFFLTDPLSRGSGLVSMSTRSMGQGAQINTATNSIALDLSTFTFNWNTGASPSLCTVEPCTQPQALGIVDGGAGSWNPATKAFSVNWTYLWSGDTTLGGDDHPYPMGTSTWTLSGVAAPVPEPEHWALLLAGIGVVSLKLRKRSGAVVVD